jgi:hypothetical protein
MNGYFTVLFRGMMNNQSNEILAECSDEEGQNGARLQDPFLLTPSVDIAVSNLYFYES